MVARFLSRMMGSDEHDVVDVAFLIVGVFLGFFIVCGILTKSFS